MEGVTFSTCCLRIGPFQRGGNTEKTCEEKRQIKLRFCDTEISTYLQFKSKSFVLAKEKVKSKFKGFLSQPSRDVRSKVN